MAASSSKMLQLARKTCRKNGSKKEFRNGKKIIPKTTPDPNQIVNSLTKYPIDPICAHLCWLLVWNMAFMAFHILGISSSQLTFTPSFFRGVGLNHQPVCHFCHVLTVLTSIVWSHDLSVSMAHVRREVAQSDREAESHREVSQNGLLSVGKAWKSNSLGYCTYCTHIFRKLPNG